MFDKVQMVYRLESRVDSLVLRLSVVGEALVDAEQALVGTDIAEGNGWMLSATNMAWGGHQKKHVEKRFQVDI